MDHPDRRLAGLVAAVVGVAVSMTVAQYALTGKALFERNYLYTVAPLAVLAGIGIAHRWPRLAEGIATLLLVIAALQAQTVPNENAQVGRLRDALTEHLPTGAAIRIGCCLDEPITFYFGARWQGDPVYALPTQYASLAQLAPGLACTPDNRFKPFEVYVCNRP